jgi:hypothetical protein
MQPQAALSKVVPSDAATPRGSRLQLPELSPSTFGGHPLPFAASFKISMTRACLAADFFNRAFSS